MHGIGRPARALETDEGHVWISVEQFEGLLDTAVGRPDVTVTFDDGNISDLEIGLPRLLERGLKARFYVCAGLLGEPGRLDEEGVRELHAAGMVIGSHGWAHRDWRSLDWGPRGASEVEEEMVRARQYLGAADRHGRVRSGRAVRLVRPPCPAGLAACRRSAGLHQRRRLGAARHLVAGAEPASPGTMDRSWPRRVMVDRPGFRHARSHPGRPDPRSGCAADLLSALPHSG